MIFIIFNYGGFVIIKREEKCVDNGVTCNIFLEGRCMIKIFSDLLYYIIISHEMCGFFHYKYKVSEYIDR